MTQRHREVLDTTRSLDARAHPLDGPWTYIYVSTCDFSLPLEGVVRTPRLHMKVDGFIIPAWIEVETPVPGVWGIRGHGGPYAVLCEG